MSRRKTQEQFEEEVNDKYGDEYAVISEYKSYIELVKFKHVCGEEWEIKPKSFYEYKLHIFCPRCRSLDKSKTDYYKKFYKKYSKDKYEIVEGTFTYGKEDVSIRHKECGRVTTRRASDNLDKFYDERNICTPCLEDKTTKDKLDKVRGKLSKHINYDEFEVISGDTTKFKLRHKVCGEEFYKYRDRIRNKDNKIPCPKCTEEARIKELEIAKQELEERKRIRDDYQDLTGRTFGRLTAIEDIGAYNDLTGWRVWKCVCECGEYTKVPSVWLRNGHTQSCGCYGREVVGVHINGRNYKRTNLVGKRFGKLVVKEAVEHKIEPNYTTWLAECDCGGTRITTQGVLQMGNANSCGCLRRRDITGETFGKLTVLKRNEELTQDKGATYWEYLCECGTVITVKLSAIVYGDRVSCGCVSMSSGEWLVKNELDKHGINYEMEYTYDDLKYKNLLRFDFAIKDARGKVEHLIEFDGKQHYIEVPSFSGSLELTQHRDNLKNEYCEKNNIPLTRIPYYKKEEVSEIVESILKNHTLI